MTSSLVSHHMVTHDLFESFFDTINSMIDILEKRHKFSSGMSGLLTGLTMFGLAYSLSISKTRTSYRRTFLGPFWLSIEQFLFTSGFFAISSALFGGQVAGRIEHVALGLVGFGLVSGMVSGSADLPNSFQGLKNSQLPIAFGVLAQILHLWHLTIYRLLGVIPLLVFGTTITPRLIAIVTVPFAVAILTCFGLGVGLFLGLISIRFRDTKPILDSASRIAFFCTPVFWTMEDVKESRGLLDLSRFDTFNPYSAFTNLFRSAIRCQSISQLFTTSIACWLSVFSIAGIVTYLVLHHRIRVWL